MSRDPLLYLVNIEESCRLILSYMVGMTGEQFQADRNTVDEGLQTAVWTQSSDTGLSNDR